MDLFTLLSRLGSAFERVMFRATGVSYWVNHHYTSLYFNEVRRDIQALHQGLQESPFERKANDEFWQIVEKYQRTYCPSELYPYLSFENDAAYAELRVRIDELLQRKDQLSTDSAFSGDFSGG